MLGVSAHCLLVLEWTMISGYPAMVEPKLHLPAIKSRTKLGELHYDTDTSPALKRIPTRIRAPPLIVSRLSSAQRLRRDKTFASANTAISRALDNLYKEYIDVNETDIENVIEITNSFLYTITHRINKNRHNLKFGEPFTSGPALSDLCNKKNYNHLTVYLPLKFKDYKLRGAYEGYTCIHTSRNASFDRFQSIRSDSHRNSLSPMKINVAIHELLSHICTSINRGVVLPLDSNSSDSDAGSHQIVVILDECVRLTIVPALQQRCLKKDDDGTLFVTKPYLFDKDPNSDTLWRYDNPSRARRMIEIMNKADRQIRSKALRLIHICTELDLTLRICSPELATMILYDMFDEDVDRLPSWQTVDLEKCFINILSYWLQHMVTGVLFHPFTAGLNVLAGISERNRVLVRNRLKRLLSNKNELLRLLKLR